jgi:hypothetical protein
MIDQSAPAHVVMAKFGGLTAFAVSMGCPITTAHRWLKNGLIPANRQVDVLLAARRAQIIINPSEFVPAIDGDGDAGGCELGNDADGRCSALDIACDDQVYRA